MASPEKSMTGYDTTKELAQKLGCASWEASSPSHRHFSPGPLHCLPSSSLDFYTCPLQSTPYILVRRLFQKCKVDYVRPYNGFPDLGLIWQFLWFYHSSLSHTGLFQGLEHSQLILTWRFLYPLFPLCRRASPSFLYDGFPLVAWVSAHMSCPQRSLPYHPI